MAPMTGRAVGRDPLSVAVSVEVSMAPVPVAPVVPAVRVLTSLATLEATELCASLRRLSIDESSALRLDAAMPVADWPAEVMEAMSSEARLSMDSRMELMTDSPGRTELMTDSKAEVNSPPTDSMSEVS